MRKTIARVLAGVALTAGLVGFAGVSQASAADYDSGYITPTSSGHAFDSSDYPSFGTLVNDFNAAGGEIGHGAATGVSSAVVGVPEGVVEIGDGIIDRATEDFDNATGGVLDN